MKYKDYIYDWRNNNKQYVTDYNRMYQRKLRKDPVKYNELRMRILIRTYLSGKIKNSFKTISAIGMTREQIAADNGMSVDQFIEMLKTHEIDHIISSHWFNKPENIHLKPYMYKHYNLQFIKREKNRHKHKFVDETDLRVRLVLTQLELDYHNSNNKYSEESFEKITKLSKLAKTLQLKVRRKYKN